MKRLKYIISALGIIAAVGCNSPEQASDVNDSESATEADGMNTTEEDNTDVETMEEKYKGSDEDLILDSL